MKFTMKKTLFLKTLMLSAATVALFGMTACSGSDDNIIGDESITELKKQSAALDQSELTDTRLALRDNVVPNDTITFYVKHGDYLARLCVALTALIAIFSISLRIRRKYQQIKTK